MEGGHFANYGDLTAETNAILVGEKEMYIIYKAIQEYSMGKLASQ